MLKYGNTIRSTVHDVANVPSNHSEDLEDLRMLLVKHSVPKNVCIRLIHKHFDTYEREVMVFDKITLPAHGTVRTSILDGWVYFGYPTY